MTWSGRRVLFVVLALVIVACASLVAWRFSVDMAEARARIGMGSILMDTTCGPIEYAETGTGPALLAVHGSGGGFDQGMAFAAPLAAQGIRVIAMSRFGYLRTPMPTDHSAEAQADAFICLMDALDLKVAAVMGGSAGARFLGFETGGHAWVGHDEEVMAAIANLVTGAQMRLLP